MKEAASGAGQKLLALGVLLIAAYVLFKLVVGFITSIAVILVVIVAVIAVIWAMRVL